LQFKGALDRYFVRKPTARDTTTPQTSHVNARQVTPSYHTLRRTHSTEDVTHVKTPSSFIHHHIKTHWGVLLKNTLLPCPLTYPSQKQNSTVRAFKM
jgi:hypothetical protein